MSDVARATGVTRGLVHHYFATKPELYEAAVESLLAEAPSVVRTDLGLEIEELVAENVDASLTFIEENRELLFAITRPGGLEADPRLARVIDRARESVVDRMVLNHLGTTVVGDEVRSLIRAYLGLFEAATAEWLVWGRAGRELTQVLLTRSLLAMVRDVLPALRQAGLREVRGDTERSRLGGSA
jgi:AcrR family transcriptional regulator